MEKRSKRIQNLRKLAADDAHHDLDGDGVFVFQRADGNPFLDYSIGGNPENTEPAGHELVGLNLLLKFHKQPSVSEESYKQSFREVFASEDETEKELPLLYETEEAPYKYKTLLAAKKATKDSPKIWEKKGKAMYDWLNVHQTADIAFMIDAISVPFYDAFDEETIDGPNLRAYSYVPRENINDPSSGNQPEAKHVTIVPVEDVCTPGLTQTIFYPHLSNPITDTSPANTTFYSKFDVNIGCIQSQNRATGPKTTRSIVTNYTTPAGLKRFDIMKGEREEAHVGSIAKVLANISRFTKKLLDAKQKKTNVSEKDDYYVELQKKRGGDWFQAHSCLDHSRFLALAKSQGHTADVKRIFLVTHDRILLSYALFLGIDVLFTFLITTETGNREYRLLFFYKAGKAVKPNDYLANIIHVSKAQSRIEHYLSPVPESLKYNYSKKRVYIIDLLTKRFVDEVAVFFNPLPKNEDQLTKRIRLLFVTLVRLASFSSLVPDLENEDASFYETYILPDERVAVSEADLEKIRVQFYKFSSNVDKIRKSVRQENWLAKDILSCSEDLNRYFDKFLTPKAGESDMIKTIDQIRIFPPQRISARAMRVFWGPQVRLFSKDVEDTNADDPRKGAGVLSYLDSLLGNETKKKLHAFFDTLLQSSLDTSIRKEELKLFVQTAKCLVKVSDRSDNAPNSSQLANSDLLDSIERVKKVLPLEEGDDKDRFQVTDFVPSLNILAERFNAHVEAKEKILQIYGNNDSNISWLSKSPTAPAIGKPSRSLQGSPVVRDLPNIVTRSLQSSPVALAAPRMVTRSLQGSPVAFAATRSVRGPPAAVEPLRRSIRLDAKIAQKGGSMPDHVPYTTFYLLLRELSHRLSQKNAHDVISLMQLSKIVQTIFQQDTNLSEQKYLEYMEYIVLKEHRRIPSSNPKDIEAIIRNFLDGYYARRSLPDSYVLEQLVSDEVIQANMVREQEIDLFAVNDCIEDNLATMDDIRSRLANLEESYRPKPQFTPTLVNSSRTPLYTPPGLAVFGGKRKTHKRNRKVRRSTYRKHK